MRRPTGAHRAALLLLLCAAACSERLYEGPPLPQEQVAVIQVGNTIVREIDGKARRGGAFDVGQFEVVPGTHHLTLVFEEPPQTLGVKTLPARTGEGTCGSSSPPKSASSTASAADRGAKSTARAGTGPGKRGCATRRPAATTTSSRAARRSRVSWSRRPPGGSAAADRRASRRTAGHRDDPHRRVEAALARPPGGADVTRIAADIAAEIAHLDRRSRPCGWRAPARRI